MFYDQVKESADYIRSKVNAKADFAVILGSGLGKIVDIMENKEIVPYSDSPAQYPIPVNKRIQKYKAKYAA